MKITYLPTHTPCDARLGLFIQARDMKEGEISRRMDDITVRYCLSYGRYRYIRDSMQAWVGTHNISEVRDDSTLMTCLVEIIHTTY